MGLGRMKHVELRFLFVKDLVKREKLSLCKVLGTENPADLGTKVLDVATHRYLCHLVGLRPVKQSWKKSRVTGGICSPLEVLGGRTCGKV